MAKDPYTDYNWYISPDVFSIVDKSLANRLSSLQQSISKLGLRKERYADTIREALRGGRLQEGKIAGDLSGKLSSLRERIAAKGLAKSGASAMLSGQLEKEAEVARQKAVADTASAITTAQSQINQLTAEEALEQEEIRRLLRQASK